MNTEDDLLHDIHQQLPSFFWERYRILAARRQAETLTPDEQTELIGLTDQTEELTLRRILALVELAERRGVSFRTQLQQFTPLPRKTLL